MPSSARRVVKAETKILKKSRDAPGASSLESLAEELTRTNGEGEQVWVTKSVVENRRSFGVIRVSTTNTGFKESTASG